MPKKKKLRAKYVSQGQRRNVAKAHRAKVDISEPQEMVKANIRRFFAHLQGKNAYVTIPKGNGYVKVKAKDYYGRPQKRFAMKTEEASE